MILGVIGLGFMGPGFSRGVNCFKATALENSIKSAYRFASLLKELNDYMVEKYTPKIKSFRKKKIGILGMAYKPNAPYVYESQPLKIVQELLKEGYEIYIHDLLAEARWKRIE